MARFLWTDPDGVARTLTLAHPLKFRDGSYGARRSRFSSVALDQRTVATEVIEDSAAEVVAAKVRFHDEPGPLLKLVSDAADGVELTYENDVLDQFPFLRLEQEGPLVALQPDSDRFGFGDWEVGVGLRTLGGNSLARLFPGFVPSTLRLPGTTGNFASTPDAPVLDITGDIDLRAAVALDDWTPASEASFINNRSGAGYALLITPSGLSLRWVETGPTTITETSTVAPTVNDGALLLVRATLDVDNGASAYEVKFFTKTSTPANAHADLVDNTGWTQLGATVTGAATTDILASTAELAFGASPGGSPRTWSGKHYAAAVLSGINGTVVFDANFTDAIPGVLTFRERANEAIVTVNQSGSPPARIERDAA